MHGDRARHNGAFGRNFDSRKSPQRPLANFSHAPSWCARALRSGYSFLLKGKLMSVAIGASAPVGQPWHPTFLVAIEYLVPCFARDAELCAEFRHRLAD